MFLKCFTLAIKRWKQACLCTWPDLFLQSSLPWHRCVSVLGGGGYARLYMARKKMVLDKLIPTILQQCYMWEPYFIHCSSDTYSYIILYGKEHTLGSFNNKFMTINEYIIVLGRGINSYFKCRTRTQTLVLHGSIKHQINSCLARNIWYNAAIKNLPASSTAAWTTNAQEIQPLMWSRSNRLQCSSSIPVLKLK